MKIFNSVGIRSKTFKHFFGLLGSGQFLELGKVLRRRLLNGVRFFRQLGLKLIAPIYNYEPVAKRRQHRQLLSLLDHEFEWRQNTEGKLRVAIIAENATTYPFSSFFIRLFSPLTDPSLTDKMVVKLFDGFSTDLSSGFDVCIVQRTALRDLASAKRLVETLRSAKAKLIIDSDDAFHSIGTDHPEHDGHRSRLQAFEYLAQSANQIWLSTPQLLASFNRFKSKSVVVQNSLDGRLWQEKRTAKKRKDSLLRLIYMGTVSHNSDFKLVLPALRNLAKKYPNRFKLTIVGVAADLPAEPWLERIYQPRGKSLYPRFVRWYLGQGPFDIGLAPLAESAFNKNKSDIKALDYLAAGIVPMVSDSAPYRSVELDRFIIRVGNKSRDWEVELEKILLDVKLFRQTSPALLAKAQSYIWSRRSSSITAKQIYQLLLEL